jgi:uncharacterized protein YueI
MDVFHELNKIVSSDIKRVELGWELYDYFVRYATKYRDNITAEKNLSVIKYKGMVITCNTRINKNEMNIVRKGDKTVKEKKRSKKKTIKGFEF